MSMRVVKTAVALSLGAFVGKPKKLAPASREVAEFPFPMFMAILLEADRHIVTDRPTRAAYREDCVKETINALVLAGKLKLSADDIVRLNRAFAKIMPSYFEQIWRYDDTKESADFRQKEFARFRAIAMA